MSFESLFPKTTEEWVVYCTSAIMFTALIGVIAGKKRRNFVTWMVVGILTSPLLVFLILLFVPSKTKQCPSCKEKVHPEATKCKHCNIDFVK